MRVFGATMDDNPTVGTAGMRIVKLLVGSQPQTVADLIKAAGVTRTAVIEQLNDLLTAGYIQRNTERLPGRGRPRYLYSATNDALKLLPTNNQHLVVTAIWCAVEELGGSELVHKVLKRVGHILAEHYNRQITAEEPVGRLRQLAELLGKEGDLVEVRKNNGRLVLHKRSCPFISMIDDNRTVCCVHQEMLSNVVGRPVHRTTSRHDGAHCCTFEIVE